MELTKEELGVQLKNLNDELSKNYNEKLASEIKALQEKYDAKIADEVNKGIENYKASIPVENRKADNDYATKAIVEEHQELTKALTEIVEKKRVGKITIPKAAPNSQLSSAAGSGLQPVQMGPYVNTVNQYGYIRENCEKISLTQSVMTIPYTDSGLSLTGGTELTAMADSNVGFAYLTFTETPYWCTVPYSKQLAKNASYDIRQIILNESQVAQDNTIDALYKTRLTAMATANKVSSSAYAGILTTQTFAQAITSSTIANQVMYATIGLLASNNINYTKNSTIQMHPSTMYQLAAISDTNNSGKRLIEWDAFGNPRFNGILINQSNSFSAPTVALTAAGSCFLGVANISDAVVLAEGSALEAELFTAGTTPGVNLITQYAEAYRVSWLGDMQIKDKRAVRFGA
jgi:HK97 family phage major capsid protein